MFGLLIHVDDLEFDDDMLRVCCNKRVAVSWPYDRNNGCKNVIAKLREADLFQTSSLTVDYINCFIEVMRCILHQIVGLCFQSYQEMHNTGTRKRYLYKSDKHDFRKNTKLMFGYCRKKHTDATPHNKCALIRCSKILEGHRAACRGVWDARTVKATIATVFPGLPVEGPAAPAPWGPPPPPWGSGPPAEGHGMPAP